MGVKEPCPPLGKKTAFHRKLGKGGSKEMMAPSMGPLLICKAYKQTQTLRPYQRKVVIQGVPLQPCGQLHCKECGITHQRYVLDLITMMEEAGIILVPLFVNAGGGSRNCAKWVILTTKWVL